MLPPAPAGLPSGGTERLRLHSGQCPFDVSRLAEAGNNPSTRLGTRRTPSQKSGKTRKLLIVYGLLVGSNAGTAFLDSASRIGGRIGRSRTLSRRINCVNIF
jgi:hypothetical protein